MGDSIIVEEAGADDRPSSGEDLYELSVRTAF